MLGEIKAYNAGIFYSREILILRAKEGNSNKEYQERREL